MHLTLNILQKIKKKKKAYFLPLRDSFVTTWEVALGRAISAHSPDPHKGSVGAHLLTRWSPKSWFWRRHTFHSLAFMLCCSACLMKSHCHFRSSACKSSTSVLSRLSGRSLSRLSMSTPFSHSVCELSLLKIVLLSVFSPFAILFPFSFPPPIQSGPPLLVSVGTLLFWYWLHHNYSPTGLSSYLDINYMSKEPVLVISQCSTKQYLC